MYGIHLYDPKQIGKPISSDENKSRLVEFEWTIETPTETGVYRVIHKGFGDHWAYFIKGPDVVQVFGKFGAVVPLEEITHWLGPLPQPDLPEK